MREISIVFFSLLLIAMIVSTVPITNTEITPVCPSKCKLDIAFALDVSGSMVSDKLEDLKNATETFINLTCPDCAWSIGIVTFNKTAQNRTYEDNDPTKGMLVPVCSEDNKTKLNTVVEGLTAGGSTNIGDGIYNATAMIRYSDRPDADDVIIVVTDGLPNEPGWTDPKDYAKAAADYAKSLGITIVAVYVGSAGGDADEWLRDNIASSPDHFINASTESGIDMEQAFLDLFDKLCPLVYTTTPMVGGSIEVSDLTIYRNLVLLIGVAVAVSVGVISVKKK